MISLSAAMAVVVLLVDSSLAMMNRDVSPGLFCAACKATMIELEKVLKKTPKRTEGDVMTAIEGICHMDNFRVYDFIPPKMVMGCEKVMEYDEELERLLQVKPPLGAEELEKQFCFGQVTR